MHIMTKKFLRSTTISRFTQSWSLLYIVVYVHLDVFIRRLFRDQMWKIYVLVGSARPERSIPQSRKYILKKAIATRQEKFYSKGDRNRKNGKDAQKAHFGNKTIYKMMMIFLGLSAAVIITAAICDIPVFYAVWTALYLWHLLACVYAAAHCRCH